MRATSERTGVELTRNVSARNREGPSTRVVVRNRSWGRQLGGTSWSRKTSQPPALVRERPAKSTVSWKNPVR